MPQTIDQVYEFLNSRKAIRSQPSDLDKCTIVSIYPKLVHERKLTCAPCDFVIESGSYEKPAILIVGSSSTFLDTNPDMDYTEVVIPSPIMANSIVNDFNGSLIEADLSDACPGLFYVQGEFSAAEIKLKHKDKLDAAKTKQDKWFQRVVLMADVDWARTNGNPIAIPNEARMAAEHLGLKNKPWMQDFQAFKMANCPACGHLYNPLFPVCGHCRNIVNKKLFEERGLTVAQ